MRKKINFRIFFLPVFFIQSLAFATIRLPAIISDNMILQQNSKATLWGWADAGEKIAVSTGWNNKTYQIQADNVGQWKLEVATAKAGGPYTIRFEGSNTIEVGNVLLGEVWLASGQSNMEFFMGKTSNSSYTGVVDYESEIKSANYPQIRTIDVPNKTADDPQTDFVGVWKICSPSTADTFSAVAFYFAKAIHQATGYPVGIINSTWGGTPAESWTRKDILQGDTGFQVILQRYEQQCRDYPTAIEKYKADLAAWRADTSRTKPAAPVEPMGPKSGKSPYKLYNGMIAPILGYTLKGVIWYQGEANAGRAWQYRRLFPAMIENWRHDFHEPNMPFYFVQISPHRSQNGEIRDAQLYTLEHVAHTGMAVTTDNGDSLNIHPRNKKLVGERLALWALKNDYGQKDIVESGPLYKSMKKEGDKIRIYFNYADGLNAKDGELKEFVISGADGAFRPANAIIEGNTVVVSAPGLSDPVAVRFAWSNVPFPNLYNKAGLPASPFRTDQFKLPTEGKN